MTSSLWVRGFASFVVAVVAVDLLGLALSILCGLGMSPTCGEWVGAVLLYDTSEWAGATQLGSYVRAGLGAAILVFTETHFSRLK